MAGITYSLSAIVRAIWNNSFVAAVDRTVTLTTASPGVRKATRRGTITIGSGAASNTATLSPAVDMSKTAVRKLGQSVSAAAAVHETEANLVLTDSTTLTATRGTTATPTVTVSYELDEGN